ncbi:hypothetical protein [Rhizobium sp. 21-4511-3d]
MLPLMDSSGVDVAAFRYSVLRTADEIPGGMPPVDKNIWDGVLGDRESAIVELDEAA